MWTPIEVATVIETLRLFASRRRVDNDALVGVFLGGKQVHCWFEDYELAVLPHAMHMLEALDSHAPREADGRGLFVLGGVYYDFSPSTDERATTLALRTASVEGERPLWRRLRATADEARWWPIRRPFVLSGAGM